MTFILSGLTLKKAEMMISGIGKIKNKGFTLLEVMVSVTILSVCLVLILNSFIRSIRAEEHSRNYFRAGLLLEQKAYELANSGIEEGFSEGSFEDFNNYFSWYADAQKIEERLSEVNIEVFWDEREVKHSLSLATYLQML
jgi:prepilin-type N-terminal cleavage/methylation domain-containing protein